MGLWTVVAYGEHNLGLLVSVLGRFALAFELESSAARRAAALQEPLLEGYAFMYLAQIATAHAGKRIRLDLWDPGEGGKTIQIRKPDGSFATFSWRTEDGHYSGRNVTSVGPL